MSAVYFHSEHGDAALKGSERAWLDHISRNVGMGALDLNYWNADTAIALVGMMEQSEDNLKRNRHLVEMAERATQQKRRDEWVGGMHDPKRMLLESLTTALNVGGFKIDVDGHALDTFSVILNTAVVLGSPPVQLAAKIHGWCEGHAWVDGPDRAWLAEVIEQGIRTGVYREYLFYPSFTALMGKEGEPGKMHSQGWREVQEVLRDRDDGPVVMSYSVCDQFPNGSIAKWEAPAMPEGWMPDWCGDEEQRAEWLAAYPTDDGRRQYFAQNYAYDAWYDVPGDEQWDLAMQGLRERRPWAQMTPANLATETFGPAVTIYDLFASDRAERIKRAWGEADLILEEE